MSPASWRENERRQAAGRACFLEPRDDHRAARHRHDAQGRDNVLTGNPSRPLPPRQGDRRAVSAAQHLAAARESCHFPDVEKKRKLPLARIHAYAEKLRFLPHLSDDERYLYAYQLAATPDERWERSQNYLRSVLSSRRLKRKK